jgi:hypothetical protein
VQIVDGQIEQVVVGEVVGDCLCIPDVEVDGVGVACVALQLVALCDRDSGDGEVNDAAYLAAGLGDGG